jgi:hypothetical protein
MRRAIESRHLFFAVLWRSYIDSPILLGIKLRSFFFILICINERCSKLADVVGERRDIIMVDSCVAGGGHKPQEGGLCVRA